MFTIKKMKLQLNNPKNDKTNTTYILHIKKAVDILFYYFYIYIYISNENQI